MNFEFATATRIVFGRGQLSEVGTLAKPFGDRALVVTGNTTGRVARLIELLGAGGIRASTFAIPGEPTLEQVGAGVARLKAEECHLVIGFGGGSAIDAGKAIGALATNEGDVMDYLEVIGRGLPLRRTSIPVIAIPTTAGTGAEVTRNAVLFAPEHRVKVSLRSPSMLPQVALVDPDLTRDLPPALTASTGLDALTQLVEPYVSLRANPITDSLCLEGLSRVAQSLRRAFADGGDLVAREDMALASLFGGLALANSGLGAVHGFAAPMGGMFPAPHGALCAALLPKVMETNLRALRSRSPDSAALRRYGAIARVLIGDPAATADEGVDWVRGLCVELGVERLSTFGVRRDDFPAVVERATRASSMKSNPIMLTADELAEILAGAW